MVKRIHTILRVVCRIVSQCSRLSKFSSLVSGMNGLVFQSLKGPVNSIEVNIGPIQGIDDHTLNVARAGRVHQLKLRRPISSSPK
jgi:hypothetical protein